MYYFVVEQATLPVVIGQVSDDEDFCCPQPEIAMVIESNRVRTNSFFIVIKNNIKSLDYILRKTRKMERQNNLSTLLYVFYVYLSNVLQ